MSNNYTSWVEKAADNLKWAEDNLKIGNFPLVCYLSQQSVELLLKGHLYKLGKIPPKVHNLIALAKECEKSGLNIDDFINDLATLSEYYFQSRYPDNLQEELNNKEAASQALDKARKIFDLVS